MKPKVKAKMKPGKGPVFRPQPAKLKKNLTRKALKVKGGGLHLAPGLAKKPGAMPPGQYKHMMNKTGPYKPGGPKAGISPVGVASPGSVTGTSAIKTEESTNTSATTKPASSALSWREKRQAAEAARVAAGGSPTDFKAKRLGRKRHRGHKGLGRRRRHKGQAKFVKKVI